MGECETILGRYRVVGRIAAGSLGTVLAAVDERTGREVAVKLFDGAEDNRAAWIDELRLAARLRHPHIPACLDAGEEPSGAPVLVFPRALGGSLRRAIAAGHPFDDASILGLLRDIGRALAHAHALRVIHRDVKPENILASERTGRGPWLLTDFGAGRFLARGALGRSLAGSRCYMAPEILLRAATPASDLYSLGMVAMELLLGALPSEPLRARFALAERRAPGLRGLVARLVDPDPQRRLFDAPALLRALDRPGADPPARTEDRAGRRYALEGDLVWRADADEGGQSVGRVAQARAFISLDGSAAALVAAPRRLAVIGDDGPATVLTDDRPLDIIAADLGEQVAWIRAGDRLIPVDLPFGAPRAPLRAPEAVLAALAAPGRVAAPLGRDALVVAEEGSKTMYFCTLSSRHLEARALDLPAPLHALLRHHGGLLATCGDAARAHLVAVDRAGLAPVAARDASVDAVRPIAGERGPALVDLAPTLASILDPHPGAAP